MHGCGQVRKYNNEKITEILKYEVKPAVMRVWSGASSSSLCQNDIGMGLVIGQDIISECLVRVSRRQVDNVS